EGTPRDRGRKHGEQMRDEIRKLLGLWKADLASNLKAWGVRTGVEDFIGRFVKKTEYRRAMKKWTPDLADEVEGIADGAGVDRDTIFAFQLLDELWVNGEGVAREGCSSLGFGRAGKQPSYVAQNMDLDTFYDGFQLVLHVKHEDSDLESFVLTAPGLIGLNGVNNRSVAVCCNTLMQLNNCRDGLPVACVIRRLLRPKSH